MCRHNPKLSRRDFFRLTGALAAGAAYWSVPGWLRAAAASASSNGKTLIVLFLRGAADGLHLFPPYRDPAYHKARPTLGRTEPGTHRGVLDLDGRFGLHPQLKPMLPIWKQGSLAVIPAAGSPEVTRSHFDAQDDLETGTPGYRKTPDGWLNRALAAAGTMDSPLNAVAMSDRLPRIFRGEQPVASMTGADAYGLSGGSAGADALESLYGGSMDSLLATAGERTSESIRKMEDVLKNAPPASPEADYHPDDLGRRLRDFAKLIKAGARLKVGFLDTGGWDTHYQQEGYLNYLLGNFGRNLGAFWTDLGGKARDVVLVGMTEFGRTVRENGAHGTDHGRASALFLMGGNVKGGKFHGPWPGLEPENLFEGRDLEMTVDFRQVYAEVLGRHLGVADTARVFPGFTPGPYLGLL